MLLDKILDKYYCRKLEYVIKEKTSYYRINLKFKYDKYYMRVYAKPFKYKEYTSIMSLLKEKSIVYLIHDEFIGKRLKEIININFEKNTWD